MSYGCKGYVFPLQLCLMLARGEFHMMNLVWNWYFEHNFFQSFPINFFFVYLKIPRISVSSTPKCLSKEGIFVMAKIGRISHYHQASFFLLLILLDFMQWHEAKTRCHMIHIPRTPEIFFFTDSEHPIKLLIGWPIIGAPDPPNPPYGGAKVFLVGVMTLGPFWP